MLNKLKNPHFSRTCPFPKSFISAVQSIFHEIERRPKSQPTFFCQDKKTATDLFWLKLTPRTVADYKRMGFFDLWLNLLLLGGCTGPGK